MAFEKEADFEAALINLLTEKYGWESEILRYKTEEELIQNWFTMLLLSPCNSSSRDKRQYKAVSSSELIAV